MVAGVCLARRAWLGLFGRAKLLLSHVEARREPRPPILLVAVSVEGAGDALDHAGLQRVGAAEFADPLLVLTRGKVARAGGAVLHLAASGEAESLLRAFMCLLLGHIRVPEPSHFGFWVES